MDLYEREQSQRRLKKIKQVFEYLDKNGGNINEISDNLNISTSSIQRYINSEEFKKLLNQEYPEISFEVVKEYLKSMKEEGNSKGGKNTQEKYGFEKNELGQFQGSRRK